ncbi:hypothetical protein BUALT_Bualt15G0095100 [Buddleja alternifolia]|uniref:Uncharacterized protein n=1 Tax=Buddleja alternifolia TaxID=168488 RepID=A0AAV6WPI6_9LAMI|nr:hypothetical protein BUALT_Bualt15G0095100 [Buddleja alternifolia]
MTFSRDQFAGNQDESEDEDVEHESEKDNFWDRKKTLRSPSEQSKLENVPTVIPDISELESNTGDVEKDMKSHVCSPTSIFKCNNSIPGTSCMLL